MVWFSTISIHQVHVFISYSWSYSGHYQILSKWIFGGSWRFGQASIAFRDFSVPKSDPIHNAITDRQLRDAIYRKIAPSHVIVIPTGMYTHYSKWIQKEIDGAAIYSKPILAVNPWGQMRKASVVAKAADVTVGWNRKPVIDGIWQLYYRRLPNLSGVMIR
jgi:hypothetical protein